MPAVYGEHHQMEVPNINLRHRVAVVEVGVEVWGEDRLEGRLEDRLEDRLEEIFHLIKVLVAEEASVNLRLQVIGSDIYVNPLKVLPNVDSTTIVPDCSAGRVFPEGFDLLEPSRRTVSPYPE
jgi:hypothetical protein